MRALLRAEHGVADAEPQGHEEILVQLEVALITYPLEGNLDGALPPWAVESLLDRLRKLVGPLSAEYEAILEALRIAHRRPTRDPKAPPTRHEMAYACHALAGVLGSGWRDAALPGRLSSHSDGRLLLAIAGAPEPAKADRKLPGGWLVGWFAKEAPTLPWPAWVRSEVEAA